jgi:hypothetical protein
VQAFQDHQQTFLEPELKSGFQELHAWIDQLPSGHLGDRSKAFEQASAITQRRDCSMAAAY